jgi:hypothetical protein
MSLDNRGGGSPRIFALVNDEFWGTYVAYSDDFGANWTKSKKQPRFQKKYKKLSVKKLWHIEPWTDARPDVVYLGVDPHALFRSDDRGETWKPVEGLLRDPTRKKWMPGGGGPCLHTIVPDYTDEDGIYIGMSAVGVFHSNNEGKSWRPLNKAVKAPWLPDMKAAVGQCVHHMVINPSRPKLLYQQNHSGVYRSDDGGELWQHIDETLPESKVEGGYTRRGFGFGMTMNHRDPSMVYIVPLMGDGFRVTYKGQMAVYRTRDGGKTWQPQSKGLPQKDAYLQVLREGLTSDRENPAGIYVGTTNGQVYYSRNEGDSWEQMAGYLPPVLSVSAHSI